MYPPIYAKVAAHSPATALLGTAPTRFYPAAIAEHGGAKPYATWQVVSGSPENYISNVPDIDGYVIQVDVWAETLTSARAVALAIRNAVEPHAHIVAWRGEETETETGLIRVGFDVSWFVSR